MVLNIDYDRGVIKQIHPTGVDIFMYVDEPGIFRNSHGDVVSDDLARGAGFDTDELGKKRLLKQRMAQAQKAIYEEMELAAHDKVVVSEREGYKVVDIGLDRFQVESPDGVVLHKAWLPKEVAVRLLNQLTPDAPRVSVERKPQETKAPESVVPAVEVKKV